MRNRRPAALRKAAARAAVETEPAWVSGSCLLARAQAVQAVAGFDEGFFLYEEDVDLCVRIRQAGWRIVFTPTAEVVHHLGRSMDQVPDLARIEYHRSHLRFYRKHNPPWQAAALRLYLITASGAGWLAALGRGSERQARRALHSRVLALGLGSST